MTLNRSQFIPSGPNKKNERADVSGAPGMPEPTESIKAAKPATNMTETTLRPADFLSYGQRDKVTTSRFPHRKRGVASVLTARTIPVMAFLGEFAVVAVTSFGAGLLYHDISLGYLPSARFYFAATLLLASMLVVPCGLERDYSMTRLTHRPEQIRSVFLHWNTAFLVFSFLLFLSHATDFYSRGALVAQYVGGLTAAIALRLAFGTLIGFCLRRGLLGGKRVVLAGEATSVAHITRQLRTDGRGLDILGIVRLPAGGEVREGDTLRDIRAAAAAIEAIARETALDQIVISMPWSDEHRIRALVECLASVPASIHLAPDNRATWTHMLTPSRVGALPTVRLSREPLSLRDRALKRVFDVAVASMLLVLCLPAFIVIGICIKLDSRGPVFFRQRRHGFNHAEFRIFKFRTMTSLDDGEVIRQATRDDARITRIGRFLRRTNLDELPQLLNVIAGQMSLVGPRPHALAHNNEYGEKIRLYAKRHNVKPGITGLSQIKGFRGETDSIEKMLKRVEYDLCYIDNWSLFLDIKIMCLTITSRQSLQNAY